MKKSDVWEIDHNEFKLLLNSEAQLRFLLRYAILAPSSHNSQPWAFGIKGTTIVVFPDKKRTLPVSDPLNRNLYIALGCSIENVHIAADYFGFKTNVELFPKESPEAVAKISLEKIREEVGDPDHLIFSIQRRRSNRGSYENQLPPQEVLAHLKNLASGEVFADFISDQKVKTQVVKFLMDFREDSFANRKFRAEMADYKRNNFSYSSVGIPGFTMGFGNLFSIVAPTLIRYMNIMRFIREPETALLTQHTPLFGVISSLGHDPKSWIAVGRLFGKILLELEKQGLQSSISALPLKGEELQHILGVAYVPQIFFRFGYAKTTPRHSPRLSVEKLLV